MISPRALLLILLTAHASVLMAGAARANERDLVDWFKTLCVDTAPSFRDVKARVTAIGGKREEWPSFRLSQAMIEVKEHRAWVIDAPMRNSGLRILRAEGTVGELPARSCWLSLKFPLGSSEKHNELLPLANAAVVEARLKAALSLGASLMTGPHVSYGRYKRWHLPMGDTTLAYIDMQEPAQWPPETQFAWLVLIVMDQTKLGRGPAETTVGRVKRSTDLTRGGLGGPMLGLRFARPNLRLGVSCG